MSAVNWFSGQSAVSSAAVVAKPRQAADETVNGDTRACWFYEEKPKLHKWSAANIHICNRQYQIQGLWRVTRLQLKISQACLTLSIKLMWNLKNKGLARGGIFRGKQRKSTHFTALYAEVKGHLETFLWHSCHLVKSQCGLRDETAFYVTL